MQLGSWISVGLAVVFAAMAPACNKGNGGRLMGAPGAEDAATQLNDLTCECLEEQGQGQACEEGGFVQEAMDAIDYACIQRVLDQHPDQRASFQCLVDVTYDLVDCLEASGCPELVVIEDNGASPEDQTDAEDPEDEISAGDRCMDDFERDLLACPELSDAFDDQVEEECLDDREVEVEGCDSSTDDCD